jgi:hypothetical protein
MINKHSVLSTDIIKSDNDLIKLSKLAKLKYNIDAKNSSKHIKINNNDKILAFELISKNEEICICEPIISYYRTTEGYNSDSKSLLLALNLQSINEILQILKNIWSFQLYPSLEEDMILGLRELYKSGNPTDEFISKIFKQPEHIIQVYIKYNHFNVDNNRYLYLLASKFNHSCNPNCDWKIENGIIKITSLRKILPSEECTISYMGIKEFTSIKSSIERQNIILNNYSFICKCKECINIPIDKCFVCDNRNNLLSCSKCKNIFYCGKDCQLLHWSIHKHNCTK